MDLSRRQQTLVRRLLAGGLLAAASAGAAAADCSFTATGVTPLPDLGAGLYRGAQGGLYSGGADTPPSGHLAAALARAAQILPLNAAGSPDPAGKIAMLSVGMSNTNFEFTRFVAVAGADPARNPSLVVVNGAQGGQAANAWTDPSAPTWATADQRLAQAGVTPRQVQVAWVKQALPQPASLGAFPAHAQALQADLEAIARNLLIRYPNVKLAYFSSRTRAYTADPATLNPEPFAYESGFAVQWMIARQTAGDASLNFDPARGAMVAPLLLWGPYLWTDGLVPRSDGFIWACQDTQADFTHPSSSGDDKVANELLAFFSTHPTATPWFLRTGGAGGLTATASARPASGAAPLTVALSAQASSAVQQYLWTFDDGTFSLQANPDKIFRVPGGYTARLTVTDAAGRAAAASAAITVNGGPAPGPGGCTPSPTVLCLQGNRFQVEATWQTAGGTGSAQAAPLTADTGSFWFFDPGNVELLVKVLDGCTVNHAFWVFAAGLTNVGVSLRVTDSSNSTFKTYTSNLGTAFLPIQDTAAFATCP